MAELKFINVVPGGSRPEPSCRCEYPSGSRDAAAAPDWISGYISTEAGMVPVVSTRLSRKDVWEHVRCRTSSFRNSYAVPPGLYAAGAPDAGSDVLVSANYKLSFDHLRRELQGLDVWILVLDTRGINVWCAAGKGTFGTDELIRRMASVSLDRIVSHRRIVLPQLGAPGVSGLTVRRATGFRVHYGPVYARDIRAFIAGGHTATREMRTVRFGITDRIVLAPMEINPAMKKYFPLYAMFILAVFGLQPSGIIFRDAWVSGLPFVVLGLLAVVTGAFVTPLLLPFIPFRSFALKGWIAGMAAFLAAMFSTGLFTDSGAMLSLAGLVFFPSASSYIALQFTGATTFTGMSGVKKELRIAIPLYILSAVISILLLALHKLGQWGVL